MRKLIQDVQARFTDFIEQRDDFTLLVRCPEIECAHVLKIIQAIDEGDSADLFWTYSDPFDSSKQFVDVVLEQFVIVHGAVSKMLEEADEDPWPPLPAHLHDEEKTPLQRLRDLMIFSRSLLPAPDGVRSVWVLCPMEINDSYGYRSLVKGIGQHQMPIPWCHHLRFIVRDDKEEPALKSVEQEVRGAQLFEPDLSREAIENSFKEEAEDESQPLELRLQSLLVLAGMDYAYQRHDDALEKYSFLNRYYRTVENDEMDALTLNGMGEVYVGLQRDLEAKEHFEMALTPGIKAEAPPILLNITLNLGNLHLRHEDWETAEEYYDSADKLASVQLNATTKVQSLENRGFCQYRQQRYGEAVESWKEAAEVARSVDEKDLLKPVLQKLIEVYDQARMVSEKQEIARELASLA